jgi:hypothetical protein
VTKSDKHSSLLRYGMKKFYCIGPKLYRKPISKSDKK